MVASADYFWERLLGWHKTSARAFPWRKTSNAFYILVAEILLQQTHVRKVEEVYAVILEKHPTPIKLSQTNVGMLRELIKPLGLAYRAGRLIRIAEIIYTEYMGIVPYKPEDLLGLPGVGRYITDAVLCYAYNMPTVPIDTNVIRVFTRYFGLRVTKARARNDKILAVEIRSLFPFKKTRAPNLAVLDFASEICKPRTPKCCDCILKSRCFSCHVN